MPRWTHEARQRQSELIRSWQPWQKSTGPTTEQGKAIASRNRSPSHYFSFHGIEIRADTKKGKKLVDQVIKTLALQRMNLISGEECCQRIAALLCKDGYIEAE